MSTRVRIVFEIDGGRYAGWRAVQQLHLLATSLGVNVPTKLPKWSELLFIYKHLTSRNKSLIMVREKRKLSANRSRYVTVCRASGIGKKIKPLRFVVPPPNTLNELQQAIARARRGEINVATPLRAERPTRTPTQGDRGIRFSTYRIPTRAPQAVPQEGIYGGTAQFPDFLDPIGDPEF
jgi:hypothetical protein